MGTSVPGGAATWARTGTRHPSGIAAGGSEPGPARTARTGVRSLLRGAGPWPLACLAFPSNGRRRPNIPNPAAWVTSSSPWRRWTGTQYTPPRSGFRGRGLGGAQSAFGRPAPPAAPPPSLQGVGRSLGVSGRCGGRCAGRCSPWCTLPPACSPPIHPLLPRPLPPATRAGSSVFQVTSAEMPPLTTQTKVPANLFSWPDLVFISFTVSLSSKSIYVVFPL